MKQSILWMTLVLVISAFTISTENNKKKDFEGKIVYNIEYLEVPEELVGFESMLAKELVMTIKYPKTKMEQEIMMGKQTFIYDSETETTTMLMDIMGQKISVVYDSTNAKDIDRKGKPTITYYDETKTILDYKCQKAVIKSEDGTETTVYYTEKIKNSKREYGDLKGMALQFTNKEDNMRIRMTASKIIEQEVNDSEFDIPSGYKKMSPEELENFGQ